MKLQKIYKVMKAVFIVFNILMFIVGIMVWDSCTYVLYRDEVGFEYPELAVDTPDFITVVDSNGEMTEAPNNQKVKFALNIQGEFVPVTRFVKFKPNYIMIVGYILGLIAYNITIIIAIKKLKYGVSYEEAEANKSYVSILEDGKDQ